MHDLSEATQAWYNALPTTTRPMTEFGDNDRITAIASYIGAVIGLAVGEIEIQPGRIAVYVGDSLRSEDLARIAACFRHEGRELRFIGMIADHEFSSFMDECGGDITERIALIYADDPRALKDAIRT